jgi:regulation of enolase protein 1 (concanavalin A-like superfamily)
MTTPYQPASPYSPAQSISTTMPLGASRPRLIAEVFRDPFFQGPRGIVIENIPFTGVLGFERSISSARVYKGPGYDSSPNFKAIFHEQRDYKGRQLVLGPGFYQNLHDIAYNFGDVISSISFGPAMVTSGPDYGTIPLIVEVYRGTNFTGQKAVVLRDISHTQQIGLHDVISSIRVFRGPNFPPAGCKAIFYEHIEFEGQTLEVALGRLEYHKELPDLYNQPKFFGGLISSIKLESWAYGGGGRFTDIVFLDEFDTLKPVWQWVDPKRDCRRELGKPAVSGVLRDRAGWLEIYVNPNHDLWWGPDGRSGNMDGPRMLQPISGDFAIETKITATKEQKEHGGLLVWKDDNHFVRLDKTSALHGFRGDIRFETHVNRRYQAIGRGVQQSVMNFLRLERTGHEFQAYCSIDGQNWQSCGTATVLMQDPVLVGVHSLCPGNTPATVTRFDYYKIIRPPALAATGMTQQPLR